MAGLCPAGMLFVRCAGGISHNPAESITLQDADIAARTLIETVKGLQQ
jgi:allantoate deiminase